MANKEGLNKLLQMTTALTVEHGVDEAHEAPQPRTAEELAELRQILAEMAQGEAPGEEEARVAMEGLNQEHQEGAAVVVQEALGALCRVQHVGDHGERALSRVRVHGRENMSQSIFRVWMGGGPVRKRK